MNIWLFCLYIAISYSVLRSCMTADKPRPRLPALPATISLLAAVLWPFFFLLTVSVDIWKGIKEVMVKTR